MRNVQSPLIGRVHKKARGHIFTDFKPLAEERRRQATDQAKNVEDPMQLRAYALRAAFEDDPDTLRHLLAYVKGSIIDIDHHKLMGEAHPYLAEAVLYEVTKDLPPEFKEGIDPQRLADDTQRVYQEHEKGLCWECVNNWLTEHGMVVEDDKIEDILRMAEEKKIPVTSDQLGELVNAVDTTSKWTKSVTDHERREIFEDFQPLPEEAEDGAIERAEKDDDASDPIALRAIAVDAAIPSFRVRKLVNAIRSAVSVSGGSSHLAAFKKLPEAILYEYLKDKPHGEAIEAEPDDVRGFAEEFFQQNKKALYMDKMREVLDDAGLAFPEEKLQRIYRQLDKEGVPLPSDRSEGGGS